MFNGGSDIYQQCIHFPGRIYDRYGTYPDSPSPVYMNANNNANVFDDKQLPLVVNLSKHTLTNAQHKILSRGLKFCPNPGEPDISQYQADLDKYHLRLKRYLHFFRPKKKQNEHDNDNNTDEIPPSAFTDVEGKDNPFKHRKFTNPSSWVPPPVANLEFFISKNNLDLSRCKPPPCGKSNISADETKALKQLASNRNIVIKPADKGGAVVILDREFYIAEGIRQLSDPKFYLQQNTDLTGKHHRDIVQILENMLMQGQIHISCYNYLADSNVRTAQFYMLPKIHKTLQNPPGRPIVSGNGCPTERISQFIDHFLQPCVKNIRSYIKDTTDFLYMLDSVGNLPANCLLVTLDVASLYTNIPNEEGCVAALESLNQYRGENSLPSNTYLIKLLNRVLKCNNFDFNGNHYLQVGGTAMGTKVAPAYANTFMGWFEEKYVYSYHKQPLLWKRFIDDIFVIWQYTESDLDDFTTYLNESMPSIKFEVDKSHTNAHFLDVTIQLNNKGELSTTLYTKPTDSHNYINFTSCHQKSCRMGIPYGQFLRLRRICSTEESFVAESRKLSLYFHRADYPAELIQSSFERAFLQDRTILITPKEETETPTDDNLYLITTHHPTFFEVNKIVSNNLELLDGSSSTRPILQTKLIRGFRRCKNLRDILVRAKIMPSNNMGENEPMRANNHKCKRPNCIYCEKLDHSGSIKSKVTDRKYITRTNITCRCTNLIYCIECISCGKHYIGQTKRRLMDRLMEHYRNIRQDRGTHIVGRHFNKPGHKGLNDLNIYVLDFIRAHPESPQAAKMRDDIEKKWIYRLTLVTLRPEYSGLSTHGPRN